MYIVSFPLLCVLVLLLPCFLASPTFPPISFSNAQRSISNSTLQPVTLTWQNFSSNTVSTLLNAEPVAVKLGLPWWTSLPSGIFDYIIAFKSITFDWDRNGGVEAIGEQLKISTFANIRFVSQCVGLAYTFIQGFAGVVHVGLNSHRMKFMRYAGAGAYTLIFANVTKLWTKMVIQNPKALSSHGPIPP